MEIFHLSPLRCTICRKNVCYEELPICCDCLSSVQQTVVERCPVCKKAVGDCECNNSDGLHFVFHYGNRVSKRFMYIIKSHMDVRVVEFLSELSVDARGLNMGSFDGVAYVPRHRRNYYKFGHDQAEEFAKSLSRRYGLPVVNALERVGGFEQKLLSRAERIKNIKGKYKIRNGYNVDRKYSKILLVDDIYTTGATMKVCADLLRGNVAHAVVPLTFTKTKFRINKGS